MSIVGYAADTTIEFKKPTPFYWSNSKAKPIKLPLLDGYKYGIANSINNLGQIVGISGDDNYSIPVIWTTPNDNPKTLQLLDGSTSGIATGINNLGQIVGYTYNLINKDIGLIPLIWDTFNDNPKTLQLLDGSTSGIATGINNLGQIVGYISDIIKSDSFFIPVIWTNTNAKPTKLQLIPIQYNQLIVTLGGININDLGQITFTSDNVLPKFLSSANSTPITLKLLNSKLQGLAGGINNLGQIVGVVGNIDSNLPVIWANADATPTPLQIPDGYENLTTFAIGISGPSTTPISNICFPAGTPVQTDQGLIHIDDIDPQKHTINNQTILHITKTTTLDNYLISFDKNSLERNIPSRKTLITKDHKIMFEGNLVPAYRFLDYSDKVKKVKYSGEILYNVLLAEYGTINVNNLMCETLHPDNIIAKLYMRELKEQPRLICQLNSSLENKDFASYTEVVHRLTHNL
jgi:uncharacterized membrane protein